MIRICEINKTISSGFFTNDKYKPNINYNTLNLNMRTLTHSNTEQSAWCHVRPSEERHDLSHTIMSMGLSKSIAVLSYKSCGIQEDMTVTYTYTYCLLYNAYTKYRAFHNVLPDYKHL